jgi:hypothetical protein
LIGKNEKRKLSPLKKKEKKNERDKFINEKWKNNQ